MGSFRYPEAFELIIMKNISQRTLQYNIDLVKYENPPPASQFDLTTVHSLLIDQNKKFVQLKQLVIDYNDRLQKKTVNRPTLNRVFIERLYKMLCEVTRMCHLNNQLSFLNKIYAWAFEGNDQDQEENYDGSNLGSKQRPGTASTKTRPYSAYTRKSRPDSAIPNKHSSGSSNKKVFESETISRSTMNKYPNVDFKKLKNGQKEFFLGHRTLHPEEEKPKVRLKDYFRKKLDEDNSKDSDNQNQFDDFYQQIQQEEQEKNNKNKFPEIPIQIQEPLQPPIGENEQKKEGENLEGQNVEGVGEGMEGAEGAIVGEEDVNIDDLVGDQEGGAIEEQQVQQIDKLRPAIKAFGKNKITDFSRKNNRKLQEGIHRDNQNRNKLVQQVEQDTQMESLMRQWGGARNKILNEQRRRAQSARILTKPVGKVFEKKQQQVIVQDGIEVIDLSKPPTMVSTKTNIRPKTAFKPESERAKQQALRDAFVTGKLEKHVYKDVIGLVQADKNVGEVPPDVRTFTSYSVKDKLSSVAPKPKKKTFEQILREAEQQVQKDAQDQILDIKQKLTMNKITIGANKIAKSLTYHQNELYEGDFTGGVTGKSMLNNPFFKVAKKKKKKKKKK